MKDTAVLPGKAGPTIIPFLIFTNAFDIYSTHTPAQSSREEKQTPFSLKLRM